MGDVGLAVYLHWPYCARICPYCDFNVYKQRADARLERAILKDLAYWRDWSGPRKVTSIHFGGGTPSLLSAQSITAFIEAIDQLWGLDTQCEIALEANPDDADETRWRDYVSAGMNRLSLGVQSFHDPALKLLGRNHDGASARQAADLARNIFPNVSLDLITGWVGQTNSLLEQDLATAIGVSADHLSTYQLTIEPGTAFAKAEARGQGKACDPELGADLYEQLCERLVVAGYDHYEVSNFAKLGQTSRHNLTYWRGGDYIGVGPGAHGRLTKDGERFATIAAMRPGDYAARVDKAGHAMESREGLSPLDWAEEFVLMGLRISDGLDMSRYTEIAGHALEETRYEPLIEDGLLELSGTRLSATPSGRLVLNAITEALLV